MSSPELVAVIPLHLVLDDDDDDLLGHGDAAAAAGTAGSQLAHSASRFENSSGAHEKCFLRAAALLLVWSDTGSTSSSRRLFLTALGGLVGVCVPEVGWESVEEEGSSLGREDVIEGRVVW
jgi:hypothetical protein